MTDTQIEYIDLKPLEKVRIAQHILSAKSLDEAVKIMDGFAANGWLTLWDNTTHADGSSYKDLPAWQAAKAQEEAEKAEVVRKCAEICEKHSAKDRPKDAWTMGFKSACKLIHDEILSLLPKE